jgi:hypothetical protein
VCSLHCPLQWFLKHLSLSSALNHHGHCSYIVTSSLPSMRNLICNLVVMDMMLLVHNIHVMWTCNPLCNFHHKFWNWPFIYSIVSMCFLWFLNQDVLYRLLFKFDLYVYCVLTLLNWHFIASISMTRSNHRVVCIVSCNQPHCHYSSILVGARALRTLWSPPVSLNQERHTMEER